MWKSYIFTYFPDIYPGTLGVSLVGKALTNKLWELNVIDLKKYAVSNRVDDALCAGGAGMLLRPDVFQAALNDCNIKNFDSIPKFYLSPRGKNLTQQDFHQISKTQGAIFLAGRFEGVDYRILKKYNFQEISVGDFVVCGGDTPAMLIIEGIVRCIQGVVGDVSSIENDSFQNFLLEHNNYTKPVLWEDEKVPDVLLSGHWAKINQFKLAESIAITKKNRPDLWAKYLKNKLM